MTSREPRGAARRPRRLTALIVTLMAVTLVIALGACVASGSPRGESLGSAGPSPSIPASPVSGIIVAIDSHGLADVRGFTLRLADGSRLVMALGNLQNPTQFPPGHLAEHEATGAPVRAYFLVQDGVPVVYRLEDA